VSDVEVIRAPGLESVPHGFLGRRGGISTGDLAGLNVGYGSNDDRAAIDENRRRATHRGEADYGRQVSLIGLPAKSP
jgi:copper oxidase (laccase) domain-containing protein